MPDADSIVVPVPLSCTECERRWDDAAERWRVYFTEDDPPRAVSYCPSCARREFGD